MRVGDRVEMVDRYRRRGSHFEPSWFDGMKGVITEIKRFGPNQRVMVHIDDERLPMVFDVRDFVVLAESSQVSMTGAE